MNFDLGIPNFHSIHETRRFFLFIAIKEYLLKNYYNYAELNKKSSILAVNFLTEQIEKLETSIIC